MPINHAGNVGAIRKELYGHWMTVSPRSSGCYKKVKAPAGVNDDLRTRTPGEVSAGNHRRLLTLCMAVEELNYIVLTRYSMGMKKRPCRGSSMKKMGESPDTAFRDIWMRSLCHNQHVINYKNTTPSRKTHTACPKSLSEAKRRRSSLSIGQSNFSSSLIRSSISRLLLSSTSPLRMNSSNILYTCSDVIRNVPRKCRTQQAKKKHCQNVKPTIWSGKKRVKERDMNKPQP